MPPEEMLRLSLKRRGDYPSGKYFPSFLGVWVVEKDRAVWVERAEFLFD